MQRVQCASCGAPSVLGASRCPRCLAPFGAESPTSGVVLPPTPVRTAGRRGRWMVAGAALVVIAILVAVLQRETSHGTSVPAVTTVPPAPDSAIRAGTDSGAVSVAETAAVSGAAVTSPAAPVASPAPSGATSSVSVPSTTVRPGVAPTGAEPAGFAYEATTWVRVRVQPDNGAQVLAVLAPGTRVEVVEIGSGWLRVRVPEGEGWAGARLLTRIR